MKEKKNKKKKVGKKRSVRTLLSSLLLVVGLLILAYPFMATAIKKVSDSKAINEFRLSKMSEEESKEFLNDMKEYNEKIKEARAFNTNAGDYLEDGGLDDRDENENKSLIDQESVVNVSGDSKVIGALIIPKIDEEIAVYYGSNSRVLQKGVGILENTSYPGDETGHSILTGHRGTHDAKIFRDLDKVEVGDHFYFETNDEFLKYVVYEYEIVDPELVKLLGIEEGRDLVTLITCHPFLINTERILVKAERAEMTDEDYDYLGISKDEEDSIIEPIKRAFIKILNNKLFLMLVALNAVVQVFFIFVIGKKDDEEEDDIDNDDYS